MKDDQAGHRMHRGACQIVVITYPQDVGIGELVIEQRVSERAIPIIGRPRLRLGGSRCHQHRSQQHRKDFLHH